MFLGGIGVLVTFLFGLAPALRAAAAPPADALKSGGGRHATRAGLFRPLVAAQIAFSFVVLFVGGLCLTSFAKLLQTDLGFDASNLVLVNVTASSTEQNQNSVRGVVGPSVGTLGAHPGHRRGELFPLGPVLGLRTQQERADPG